MSFAPQTVPGHPQLLLCQRKMAALGSVLIIAKSTQWQKDSYPLPNIQELFDTLGGASVFTTVDLRSGGRPGHFPSNSSKQMALWTHIVYCVHD